MVYRNVFRRTGSGPGPDPDPFDSAARGRALFALCAEGGDVAGIAEDSMVNCANKGEW